MSNEPAEAEEVQHTLYLNIKRNWKQEVDEPFYASKVFFLKDGRIGMEYGGRVIIRSIELWMSSAEVRTMPKPEPELYFE
jgi:hypothetical protein